MAASNRQPSASAPRVSVLFSVLISFVVLGFPLPLLLHRPHSHPIIHHHYISQFYSYSVWVRVRMYVWLMH
uniref:Uncharacterized protein n=1 Tax=Anopheles darlingi TaxID=43151 RepID=A0A2M4DKC8_ANODA